MKLTRAEVVERVVFLVAIIVLMMDVLEHVDDDRGLVRHYAAKVPSGAHLTPSMTKSANRLPFARR